MGWLATSLLLSVVLTVVLNVVLRAWPRSGERFERWVTDATTPSPDPFRDRPSSGARVVVPWRAMIVASLVLTIGLNLLLWLF